MEGVSGGVAYLIPRTQGSFYKVEWRFGRDLKIAIHENGEKVNYPNGPYKNRLKLFPNNTLRVDHLRKNDSNTYWVYMEDGAGTEHPESIRLQVYGELGGWSYQPAGNGVAVTSPCLLQTQSPNPP